MVQETVQHIVVVRAQPFSREGEFEKAVSHYESLGYKGKGVTSFWRGVKVKEGGSKVYNPKKK